MKTKRTAIAVFLSLIIILTPFSQRAYGLQQINPQEKAKSALTGSSKIVLNKGSRGYKVIDLQKRLCASGFKIALTGVYDEATFQAVKEFQTLAGLNPTGCLDTDTNSLISLMDLIDLGPTKLKASVKDVKDAASKENFINKNNYASYTGYFIWVNKASFTVNIFIGEKGDWKIIKQFPCTIGIGGGYETPCGIFQTGTKGKYFLSKYNVSAKYFTHITDHILFHSILFDPKGKRIVDSRLKMRLSHGCIRLAIPDAIYIYNYIVQGTTVLIN